MGGMSTGLKSKKPGALSVGFEDDSPALAPAPAKRNKSTKPPTIVTDDDEINFSKGNEGKFD